MGDIGLDGVIILQWMLNRMERGVCGLGSSESRTGPVTGSYECDNVPSGFIKCRELLD